MLATATADAQRLLGGEAFPDVESVSLRLNKFVRVAEKQKRETIKNEEIDKVVACHRKHRRAIPAVQPPGAVSFTATLGGRLIVNQAGGVLENAGLCLHRHFGDPYIPGSAVKGLARHAAWLEWQAAEGAAKEALADTMSRVFGDTARGGGVAFLNAVPQGPVSLAVDIVNCHHPKYYGASPSDDPTAYDNESPNPQFFPTVEAGAEFRFTLVPLSRLTDTDRLLGQAKAWLIAALTLHGAGAKTAAGYGWFLYDAEREAREMAETHARQEREAAESKRKAEEELRLAALGPVERATDQIMKLAPEPFAHFAKALASKSEDEQRAFIRLMRHPAKKDWWKTKRKRDESLAASIRAVAAQLKEELT